MSDGGKGSAPRPYSVDQDTFADNWDKIFGKKEKQKSEDFESLFTKEQIEQFTAEPQCAVCGRVILCGVDKLCSLENCGLK